jgi:CubicO group peptidase (beta-lactamase class C family)
MPTHLVRSAVGRSVPAAVRVVALAVLAAGVAAQSPSARPRSAPSPRDLAGFEARLDAVRAELRIPGMSAAVAQDGRIIWAKGFGYADAENRVPAAPGTSYHLASLTKTFASTIILRLVEQGKLALDDPVAKYGVELQSPGVIRVRHLLSHTSHGEPGASYRYDGNRYAMLDRVVAKAAGRSFGELLVEQIIRPLGLEHTAPNPQDSASFRLAGLDRARFERNLAKGYMLDSTGRAAPVAYPASFGVSAGLVSSAVDVATYAMAMDANRFLAPETKARAWTPTVSTGGDTLPYGLGWIVQQLGDARLVWHYGYWTGNSSLIIKVPERRLTFVVLANSEMLSRPFPLGVGDLMGSLVALEFARTWTLDAAASRVPALAAAAADSLPAQWRAVRGSAAQPLFVKQVLALARVRELTRDQAAADPLRRAYIDQRRTALDSATLGAYVGRYELPDGTTVAVASDGTKLLLAIGAQPQREIYPESIETFFFGTVDAHVVFGRAPSGRVTKATFYQGGRRTGVASRQRSGAGGPGV